MKTSQLLTKETSKPMINLPKHKETNSMTSRYNLGKYLIEINSHVGHQVQTSEYDMKIIKEETKEVVFEQPIRHDTIIEKDEIIFI